MMSRIDSRHWTISTGRHFQNGDIIIYPHVKLWWFRTMLNFCNIVVAILKMATRRNCLPQYHTNSTLSDFNAISYVGRLWCPELIPDIEQFLLVAILMSGINSGHHYLPTYQILMISDNVEFLWYCGGHFENGDQ
jgi:hypothetical protein